MLAQGSGDNAATCQIKALGGLIKQQQLRANQQQLCQRKQLALTARKIVRVTRLQARQAQARCLLLCCGLVVSAGRSPFHQLVAHRFGDQQCLGILWQQRRRSRPTHHAATLQLSRLGQHREHRRLAAAVSAHDRMHRAGRKRHIEPTQHPTARAIVAKPALANSCRRTRRRPLSGPTRVQSQKPLATTQTRQVNHISHATALNPVRTRRILEHRPRLMRSHNNRAAQLTVHAKQRVQKILLGNGIELRRGLVE